MVRTIYGAMLCCSLSALAASPKFSEGGFLVSIQYGPGFWGIDQPRVAAQIGVAAASAYAGELQNTHTVSLGLGYSILGHASIGADLTATGWNIATSNRGGAGFAIGRLAWHPLQLVWMQKELRPLPLDVSLFFGVGYGIAGRSTGMDGVVFETGVNADYWFARYFGIGFFARFVFLNFSNFYLDYNNRSQPGATMALKDGSGGTFITVGFALHLRAGE